MANPPPSNHTELTPERQTPPPTPRWVKVFGIIAIVVVVLFVVLQFIGGGHGPGRHLPSATTNNTSPANVTEHDAHQP
jgi:hypothetical protein